MSIQYPRAIENLIEQFSKLPGVGRKTAERYVFFISKQSPSQIKILAKELNNLSSSINFCQECFVLSEKNTCSICSNQKRDSSYLCIVSSLQDIISIESTNQYNGKYFVLNNLINTIEDIGPEKINIKDLIKKINKLVKELSEIEIILALSPTIEGETTSLYLRKIINSPKIKMSKLAQGLSIGSSLEYVDEDTLGKALKNRNKL